MMRARPGIALFLVLFMILLLQLITAGVLAIATLQRTLAQTRTATARAELAARAGSGAALEDWAATTAARLPDGERTSGPAGSVTGAFYETTIERVSGSTFVVRSSARVGAAGRPIAIASAGFLVQALDPDPLASVFPAALSSGGSITLDGASQVDGARANDLPPRWPATRCDGLRPLPASSTAVLVPGSERLIMHDGAVVTGSPAITAGAAPSNLAPDLQTLAARADHTVAGALTLHPRASSGQCDRDDQENWGAPLDPRHPCFDFFPLIHAPGDLQLTGGSGQGILLVEGDLTISGASFDGAIIVLGRLTLENAQVRGAVSNLNGTAPIVLKNASVSRCECSLRAAVLLSDALSIPLARPGRAWVPVY